MWNPDEVKPAGKIRTHTVRSKDEIKELLMKYAQEVCKKKVINRADFCEKYGIVPNTFHNWIKKIPELKKLERMFFDGNEYDNEYQLTKITFSLYSIYDKEYKPMSLGLYRQGILDNKVQSRTQFCQENNIPYVHFCFWIEGDPHLIKLEKEYFEKRKTYTNTTVEQAKDLESFSANHSVSKALNDSDWPKALEEKPSKVKTPELVETSRPSTSYSLSGPLSQSDGPKTMEEVIQTAKNSGLNEEYESIELQVMNEISCLLDDLPINNQVLIHTNIEQTNTQNQKNSAKEILVWVNRAIKRRVDQLFLCR